MIELGKKKYPMLIQSLKAATINTLFALSVIEGYVDGKVFVDDEVNPASFYLEHPYGMALLYGENGKDAFYEEVKSHLLNLDKTRTRTVWLQVYPSALYPKMDSLLGEHLIKKEPDEPYSNTSTAEADKILQYKRINFNFQEEHYLALKRQLSHEDDEIIATTEDLFNQMNGAVLPKYFWNNYQDFSKNGIGFTLLQNGVAVSTAFASVLTNHKLEIGIETSETHRGSGFATRVCVPLIDYCLKNGLEPVWSCNSGNIGSRGLAKSLGFTECKRIPYYRLPI